MVTFNNNSQFVAEFHSDNEAFAAFTSQSPPMAAVFEQIFQGSTGVINYNGAINKPQINGVELIGNKSSADLYIVSENTVSGWNSNPQYLPQKGEICIYTDYTSVVDDQGRTITYPEIKIGDGNSYLIDLPLATDAARYFVLNKLQEHINDTAVHIQPGEREFWNNKLNYDMSSETLILTRN